MEIIQNTVLAIAVVLLVVLIFSCFKMESPFERPRKHEPRKPYLCEMDTGLKTIEQAIKEYNQKLEQMEKGTMTTTSDNLIVNYEIRKNE